jgi:hypothetical protein
MDINTFDEYILHVVIKFDVKIFQKPLIQAIY